MTEAQDSGASQSPRPRGEDIPAAADVLLDDGYSLADRGETLEAASIFEQLVSVYEQSDDPDDSWSVNQALLVLASLALIEGRSEDGLSQCDTALERFRSDDAQRDLADGDIDWRVQFASLLKLRGHALGQLGRADDATQAYDELYERFEADDDPLVQTQIAGAANAKAWMLAQAGHAPLALPLFDEAIRRAHDDTHPEARGEVVRALLNKGRTYDDLGHFDEALEAFDRLIYEAQANPLVIEVRARPPLGPESSFASSVAWARVLKGVTLANKGDAEAALEAYDEAIAANDAVTDAHTGALYYKARLLDELGRTSEAVETCDTLLAIPGYVDSPETRSHALQMRARRDWLASQLPQSRPTKRRWLRRER